MVLEPLEEEEEEGMAEEGEVEREDSEGDREDGTEDEQADNALGQGAGQYQGPIIITRGWFYNYSSCYYSIIPSFSCNSEQEEEVAEEKEEGMAEEEEVEREDSEGDREDGTEDEQADNALGQGAGQYQGSISGGWSIIVCNFRARRGGGGRGGG